jgi:hypothetical protein
MPPAVHRATAGQAGRSGIDLPCSFVRIKRPAPATTRRPNSTVISAAAPWAAISSGPTAPSSTPMPGAPTQPNVTPLTKNATTPKPSSGRTPRSSAFIPRSSTSAETFAFWPNATAGRYRIDANAKARVEVYKNLFVSISFFDNYDRKNPSHFDAPERLSCRHVCRL